MSLLDDYNNNRRRKDGDDARPLFNPIDTELRIEARLINVEHIDEPNTFGEYEFTFDPLDTMDYAKLENTVDELLAEWDRKRGWQTGQGEWHTATNKVFNRRGGCVVSQLFAPKLPKSDDEYFAKRLSGETVSLKLHFRDDPIGNLYAQCEYVDVYEQSRPLTQFELECLEDPDGGCDIDW